MGKEGAGARKTNKSGNGDVIKPGSLHTFECRNEPDSGHSKLGVGIFQKTGNSDCCHDHFGV